MINVYSIGLCYASVCVPKDMSIEDITSELNASHPTGISSNWELSKNTHFATGGTNPCECEHDSGRLHYLFNC